MLINSISYNRIKFHENLLSSFRIIRENRERRIKNINNSYIFSLYVHKVESGIHFQKVIIVQIWFNYSFIICEQLVKKCIIFLQ